MPIPFSPFCNRQPKDLDFRYVRLPMHALEPSDILCRSLHVDNRLAFHAFRLRLGCWLRLFSRTCHRGGSAGHDKVSEFWNRHFKTTPDDTSYHPIGNPS